jgi:hypothetical protein
VSTSIARWGIHSTRNWLYAMACMTCVLVSGLSSAGELMFMPSFAVVQKTSSQHDPTLQEHQFFGDVFYSGDTGRLRLLGELQIEDDADARWGWDVERLEAGWRLSTDLTLWFGRYHNPLGYWNIEYHHGHYMETSAERPRILAFEDEGGPFPIHLAGFLLDGFKPIGQASIEYELGAASGPRVTDGKFEAVDVIRDPRWNKLALVGRITLRPDATLDDQFGAFLADTRIPLEIGVYEEIQQVISGAYFVRDLDRIRLFSEVFYVDHHVVDGAGTAWPSYWAGYAQAEYRLVPYKWTLFGRHEAVSNRLTADYRALFPALPRMRQIAGVRWDFLDRQALKLEAIRDADFASGVFNAVELQWSAMF